MKRLMATLGVTASIVVLLWLIRQVYRNSSILRELRPLAEDVVDMEDDWK